MRSENEIRDVVGDLLEIVINPPDNLDASRYEEARFYLGSLLWVLEEFDADRISRPFHIEPSKR